MCRTPRATQVSAASCFSCSSLSVLIVKRALDPDMNFQGGVARRGFSRVIAERASFRTQACPCGYQAGMRATRSGLTGETARRRDRTSLSIPKPGQRLRLPSRHLGVQFSLLQGLEMEGQVTSSSNTVSSLPAELTGGARGQSVSCRVWVKDPSWPQSTPPLLGQRSV